MDEQVSQLNGNVRAEMARRGLTQSDLATKAGMSQPALSRRLTGDAEWTVSELYAVAMVLRVQVTALLPKAEAA
jgi:transcriptional regulator with XRE-family HTH domain